MDGSELGGDGYPGELHRSHQVKDVPSPLFYLSNKAQLMVHCLTCEYWLGRGVMEKCVSAVYQFEPPFLSTLLLLLHEALKRPSFPSMNVKVCLSSELNDLSN